MQLKYLIMDNLAPIKDMELPVIFPDVVQHDVMAQSLGGKEHVVAAGFVSFYVDNNADFKAAVYGSSFSLGIKGRGQIDVDIIEQSLQ